MAYRAIANFRIAKLIVSKDDLYSGDDIDHLLKLGLIKQEESLEPKPMEGSDVQEVSPTPLSPEPKKKPKKKPKE